MIHMKARVVFKWLAMHEYAIRMVAYVLFLSTRDYTC